MGTTHSHSQCVRKRCLGLHSGDDDFGPTQRRRDGLRSVRLGHHHRVRHDGGERNPSRESRVGELRAYSGQPNFSCRCICMQGNGSIL